MAEIGAFFLRTDTELMFKSRRVVPGRLRDAGFTFEFPEWPAAAADLVARWRERRDDAGPHGRVRDLSDTSHLVEGPLGRRIVPWYKQRRRSCGWVD